MATRMTLAAEAQGGELLRTSGLRDFWRLCKPNVMQLVIFTSAVAVYLASGQVHALLEITALICIALGAAVFRHDFRAGARPFVACIKVFRCAFDLGEWKGKFHPHP